MASPSPSVGRDDHFIHVAGIDPADQMCDARLFRPDTVQRRKRSMQHVVDAVEELGLFDRGDIGRLLDHAHQSLVARRARAVDAGSTSVMLLQTEHSRRLALTSRTAAARASASSSLARRM